MSWNVLEEPDESHVVEIDWDEESYPDKSDCEGQEDRIHEGDWDTLFILDACRWDALNIALGDTEVEAVRTPASNTWDWLDRVWKDVNWPELTYVSGTSMTRPDNHANEVLQELDLDESIGLVQTSAGIHKPNSGKLESAWDSLLGTTRPALVSTISGRYNTPKVVHLLQPHAPFIGDVLFQIKRGAKETDITGDGNGRIYPTVMERNLPIDLIQLAYFCNLIKALEAVDMYLEDHPGERVVLTSDHGEIITEEFCGHGTMDADGTRVVPWAVVQKGSS